jgi:cobalamin biosynthesis Co2+ chelatase CbiK
MEINRIHKGKTVLSQMQSIIFGYEFKKVVNEYNRYKGIRSLTTANLLSVMLYVHLAGKQSLRDIVDSLMSKQNLWYHLGISSLSRNNLSYALQNRSSEIFEKTFICCYHAFKKRGK